MNRREFVNKENKHLDRFLGYPDEQRLLFGWRRHYLCDCGFAGTSPGEIFDHQCSSDGRDVPVKR